MRADAAQLLDGDGVEAEVAARAAVGLGKAGAEDSRRAALLPQRARRHAGLLPGQQMRRDLCGDEAPHHVAERLVLRRVERARDAQRRARAHAAA